MNIKNWFNQHKVLLIGLLMAAALPINDLLTTGETNVKTLVISGFAAVLSFGARNFRGQWATIALNFRINHVICRLSFFFQLLIL